MWIRWWFEMERKKQAKRHSKRRANTHTHTLLQTHSTVWVTKERQNETKHWFNVLKYSPYSHRDKRGGTRHKVHQLWNKECVQQSKYSLNSSFFPFLVCSCMYRSIYKKIFALRSVLFSFCSVFVQQREKCPSNYKSRHF